MQKNRIHILSTGQVDKDLVEEGSKRNIIIDEIPFISTEAINQQYTERKYRKSFRKKYQRCFYQCECC